MQDLIVYAIVVGAVVYLGRTWWSASKSGGCSGCKSCASSDKSKAAPKEPQLVQIDLGGSWKK